MKNSHQTSFTDIEYSSRRRTTPLDEFLGAMEEIIPWDEWVAFVERYLPEDERGQPSAEIEPLLRMYLLQSWYSLSEEGVLDRIYDSYAFRTFMKVDFVRVHPPDSAALLKFHHLLKKHNIDKVFSDAISGTLREHGYMIRGGSVVEPVIVSKNQEK